MLRLLERGRIELVGRLWASTNQAMLGRVVEDAEAASPRDADAEAEAEAVGTPAVDIVYKPTAGERPLHDFPFGTLTRREVAAFAVSEATGWSIVPATVLRDGPFGEGMVQAWLEPDPTIDVIALVLADDVRLRRVALFDAIVNNTDRKAGHLLPLPSGEIRGVDHGVTFSVRPKLRTVLWAWQGERIADDELAVLRRIRHELDGSLGRRLRELLAAEEVAATAARVDALVGAGTFPDPPSDWPAVPWPPY